MVLRRVARLLVLAYLLSSAVWVAASAGATAQPEPIDEFWTWSQFLKWMASPGGISVVVGILLSVGVEYIPTFVALEKKWKRAVFFGLSLAIPMLAALLGVWTDGWAATWADTFWPAAWAGGLAFAAGTMADGYLPKLPVYPRPSPSNPES